MVVQQNKKRTKKLERYMKIQWMVRAPLSFKQQFFTDDCATVLNQTTEQKED